MSTAKHTWRLSERVNDTVVSDQPTGHDEPSAVEYYGGHLVAESIPVKFRPLIAAAPALLTELKAARGYLAAMFEELRASVVVPGTDTIENDGDAVLVEKDKERLARIDAVIAKAEGGQ